MKIRITKSCAGPWGSAGKGQIREVGPDITRALALEFLSSGLAVAVKDTGTETAEYPVHVGGGWYETSAGDRVRGKEAAIAAEADTDG